MNLLEILSSKRFFLTDGGLESTLIFHRGIELRHFSAFELLNDAKGLQTLEEYYIPYMNLSSRYDAGFIFETPTWRANPDWGAKLGYSRDELSAINKSAVQLGRKMVRQHRKNDQPMLISGNIGPRGDGYFPDNIMTPVEARSYHFDQIQAFSLADADLVTALTINYLEEAIGIAQAAKTFHIPVVISFTVETDGRLPDGKTLEEVIGQTDEATQGYPAFYMINCAHPRHFIDSLSSGQTWTSRIQGIRANASLKSHAELDQSESLDTGDKNLLSTGYQQITELLPEIHVIGGCCGTDHSHIDQICQTLTTHLSNQFHH